MKLPMRPLSISLSFVFGCSLRNNCGFDESTREKVIGGKKYVSFSSSLLNRISLNSCFQTKFFLQFTYVNQSGSTNPLGINLL